MSFIKVTAKQCNQQGMTAPQLPAMEFHLNIDLIGAISGNGVLLKGGAIINMGGHWYTDFKLAHGQKIPNAL